MRGLLFWLVSALLAPAFLNAPTGDLNAFLQEARRIVKAGDVRALRELGENNDTIHWYIWLREQDRLPNWAVDLFPAPKGYGKPGEQWLIFHKFQLVEELCDRVHPVVQTPNGWRLGAEVPEGVETPFRIERHEIEIWFEPKARAARFRDAFVVRRVSPDDRALLMRLNAPYKVKSAKLSGEGIPLLIFEGESRPQPPVQGTWMGRAGGLLWLQSDKPLPDQIQIEIEYEGTVWFPPNDRISEKYALLCSYWYPHIGRLPARHRVTMHVPPDWIAIGQGELQEEARTEHEYRAIWQNDLPVCFFSVVAGPFQIGAEIRSQHSRRLIRVYQLRIEKGRAEQLARKVAQGMDFFEQHFIPFPYSHYDVVETPDFGFSGLEAYSFTFLDPAISLWACTHELAHSWWGGIVPNTYLHSIWNESMTQYSDSVLFQNDADQTLAMGAASIRMGRTVPIGKANVPRDTIMALAGYLRGAYVLRMLEYEIGRDKMLEAMRQFARKRAGQASEWSHFLEAVNEVMGSDYRWFFRQWIESADVPTLKIQPLPPRKHGDRWQLTVRLTQSGTPQPYRLRIPIQLKSAEGESRLEIVQMHSASAEFQFTTPFRVKRVVIPEATGHTLLRPPPAGSLSVEVE
ncbi:Aminopeptidase N [bacterium HR15]|nr:Aminopeptidase N [bacterium HR15]